MRLPLDLEYYVFSTNTKVLLVMHLDAHKINGTCDTADVRPCCILDLCRTMMAVGTTGTGPVGVYSTYTMDPHPNNRLPNWYMCIHTYRIYT